MIYTLISLICACICTYCTYRFYKTYKTLDDEQLRKLWESDIYDDSEEDHN